ncbi:hypothetical protein JHD46_05345 [Sulfurimonas sp. SAG-AH-194-C20]|nr:hypothetical protein [Sulfurimonas sp. SAG-AH-194-C20]MDF1879064.1 hypothetical protein [Sulfurimonas sp. SAG-AH-194-C20]
MEYNERRNLGVEYDKKNKTTNIKDITLYAGFYREYPNGKTTTHNGFNSSGQEYTIRYSLGFDTKGIGAIEYIKEKIKFGLTENERMYLLEKLEEDGDHVLNSDVRVMGKYYDFTEYLEPVQTVTGYTLNPTPIITEFTQLIHKTLDGAYESHLISYFRHHYLGKTRVEIFESIAFYDWSSEIGDVEEAHGGKLTETQSNEVKSYFNQSVLDRIQFSIKGKEVAIAFYNTLDEIEFNYD